jgi:hypothetical protein
MKFWFDCVMADSGLKKPHAMAQGGSVNVFLAWGFRVELILSSYQCHPFHARRKLFLFWILEQ